MKNIHTFLRFILLAILSSGILSCVHDEKYSTPDGSSQCTDLSADKTLNAISLHDAKALYDKKTAYVFPDDSKLYLEGFVSSSDETGNIYKTIYIQDKAENPTEGFVISVNAVSTYVNYPQGAKIYVKLAGLALGEYGGVIQLGKRTGTETRPTDVSRIPENIIPKTIFRSCADKAVIVPKVVTLAELGTNFDQYIGILAKVQNAEFDQSTLCMPYAPEGQTVDRRIIDPTKGSVSTRVVRNSGYASFAGKTMPAGNGDFIGILSKYNSVYQFYIVDESNLNMVKFPRIDGIAKAPCAPDAAAKPKTVAEVKALLKGDIYQISDNYSVTAKVTANDETGNLYKYFYIEDATGGLRVNIDMTNLYLDKRFQVGRTITISLKDLYLGNVNGETQLGGLNGNKVGWTPSTMIYDHFFSTDRPLTAVTATERTISTLKPEDVGRWIKLKDVEFVAADLGKNYAEGTTTNRTLEDCSGKTVILRTSGKADFGTKDFPLKSTEVEIDPGKGDVYAILSIYDGVYQLWVTKLRDIDLDNPRCDGTLPPKLNAKEIFKDEFNNLSNWTSVNVSGASTWATTTFGNPAPSAIMDGKRLQNEDWLVLSRPIALNGYSGYFLTFETDARFTGNSLEVYATSNYTGTPSTTSWTRLQATLDDDLAGFNGWVNSGRVDLKDFAGKNVVIAFKYTSVNGASTTWEVDNFTVKGTK